MKTVVALSGGVDSSVAAALLKNEGRELVGLFMKNWQAQEGESCSSAADYQDALAVATHLDFPLYSVNHSKEYWQKVFKNFLEDYKSGFTPNPDILCNRHIKFDVFLEDVKNYGASKLATGHYARIKKEQEEYHLYKALDPAKDQSYFLAGVRAEVLQKLEFPLGEIKKEKVRELATEQKLLTAQKKDSTGLCFIGERKIRPFLQKFIKAQKGDFLHYPDGEKVGIHEGSSFYTPGQRKGLALGGEGEPWFVHSIDAAKNIVWVLRGAEHPALFYKGVEFEDLNKLGSFEWPQDLGDSVKLKAKLRYRQADQDLELWGPDARGRQRVVFSQAQRSPCVGQYIVFYQGDRCLGGARVNALTK